MVSKPVSLYQKILQAQTSTTVQRIVDQENSKRIRVHMPAKVIAVNGNTVDVQIQGQEDSGLGYYVDFAPLLDLPIVYNNYTRKAFIITPIQVGDTGLVEFLDFNSSAFNEDGKASLTNDQLPHSLNNGIFINGFIPNTKVVQIAYKNTSVTSKENNKTMVQEPTDEIFDRPIVQNDDGTYSTAENTDLIIDKEWYKAFDLPDIPNTQGYLAIIPTVFDKAHHTYEEAVKRFYKTGLHFGIFLVIMNGEEPSADDIKLTEQYAVNVHNAQEEYTDGLNNALTMGLRNNTFAFSVDDTGTLNIHSMSTKFSSSTDITVNTPNFNCSGSISCGDGATGTFSSADGKTITVTNGIITDIE